MLGLALTFLIIALIAGALGLGGIAVLSAGLAKILFFVFIALFLVSLIAGGVGRASRGRMP